MKKKKKISSSCGFPEGPGSLPAQTLPNHGTLEARYSLLVQAGCRQHPHGRINSGHVSTICNKCPAVADRWHFPFSKSHALILFLWLTGKRNWSQCLGSYRKWMHKTRWNFPISGVLQPLKVSEWRQVSNDVILSQITSRSWRFLEKDLQAWGLAEGGVGKGSSAWRPFPTHSIMSQVGVRVISKENYRGLGKKLLTYRELVDPLWACLHCVPLAPYVPLLFIGIHL